MRVDPPLQGTVSQSSFLKAKVFYPLLTASLLFNLVVGGQVFDLLPLLTSLTSLADPSVETMTADPLHQLTSLLTSKLMEGLEEDVGWGEEQNKVHNPIRALENVKEERDATFGKKKRFQRRKPLEGFRDK